MIINRQILLATLFLIIFTVGVNLLLTQTDLMLYLRTQVAPELPGKNSVTKPFTWTAPADTELGEKTLHLQASDGIDTVTQDVVITVLEESAPEESPSPLGSPEPSAPVASPEES